MNFLEKEPLFVNRDSEAYKAGEKLAQETMAEIREALSNYHALYGDTCIRLGTPSEPCWGTTQCVDEDDSGEPIYACEGHAEAVGSDRDYEEEPQ